MYDSEVMCRQKVNTPLVYLSKFYGIYNLHKYYIYLQKLGGRLINTDFLIEQVSELMESGLIMPNVKQCME